ncbi:MAG: hypothetical protein SGCHY_004078 [Lobulomycetales sp.]
MQILALLALFTATSNAALPAGFRWCKGHTPLVQVTDISVGRVQAGGFATVRVKAKLSSVSVEQGSKLRLKGRWKWLTVIDEQVDLCQSSQLGGGDLCPFTPDADRVYDLVVKQPITNLAPKGIMVTVNVGAFNHNRVELMCFSFPVKIE